jgi:H+/gluconate symporter-like permease
LAIVLPAIACIVAGIFLSDVVEDRSALLLATQQEQQQKEPAKKTSILPQTIPGELVPVQPLSSAAQAEIIAARQKRIQELEEAELARIAS